MEIYVVKAGDSVDSIAAAFGISVEALIYYNQIPYPYKLAVGQALLITEEDTVSNDPARRMITVNGYAYPFISPYVLRETLPFLTYLSVFSYGFTPEGDLIPPILDDNFMIVMAKENGASPLLTLTPFGADGQFNNYLITSVVNNPAAKENLIGQIVETLPMRGFEGVDVDFEFILADDRVAFAEFVTQLRTAVNALGYPVSVALAPKTSDTQQGLLYEGKDYALLGAAADSVLLMTYEWGYTYGPPMAVAPINSVRRVVDYAVTKIPAEKIDLGIPNYGYDWPLPFERGVTRAKTIGNVEAVQIAIEHDAVIQFDTTAMSPYFTYEADGILHEVWFEDVRSLREKFRVITDYGLRGAGYWQIMQLFRANWMLLSDIFRIQKRSNTPPPAAES